MTCQSPACRNVDPFIPAAVAEEGRAVCRGADEAERDDGGREAGDLMMDKSGGEEGKIEE
jgi:hypothetical protein